MLSVILSLSAARRSDQAQGFQKMSSLHNASPGCDLTINTPGIHPWDLKRLNRDFRIVGEGGWNSHRACYF